MDREAGVLQDRIEVAALARARATTRAKGLDVSRMNSRKAAPSRPCTPSASARSLAGMADENSAISAPQSDSTSTHSSIEPS